MLLLIKKGWQAYIDWCDSMGFTPENRRCCAPQLAEPELEQCGCKITTCNESNHVEPLEPSKSDS